MSAIYKCKACHAPFGSYVEAEQHACAEHVNYTFTENVKGHTVDPTKVDQYGVEHEIPIRSVI